MTTITRQKLRFAESQEVKVLREMRGDVAKAFAAAEALKSITPLLTPDQKAIVSSVMATEIKKQER